MLRNKIRTLDGVIGGFSVHPNARTGAPSAPCKLRGARLTHTSSPSPEFLPTNSPKFVKFSQIKHPRPKSTSCIAKASSFCFPPSCTKTVSSGLNVSTPTSRTPISTSSSATSLPKYG